jgi:ABC-type multidrug transport system fused ATPase/permease subunit
VLPNFDRDLVATYLRPQRPRLVLLAAVLAASIGLQLANPELLRAFIDRAQGGAGSPALLRIAAGFLTVALLTQLATIVETYIAEDIGWRTTNALRADLIRHVLSLDDSFHAEHAAGELIERIDGDVSAIAGFFSRFIVYVVGSALFLVAVLVLLWRQEWRIGATLTVFAGAAILFMTRGGSFVSEHAREARRASAALSGFLEERLAGLPDIKANGADDYAMRRLHEHLRARFTSGRRSVMAGSLFSNAVNVLFVGGAVASLAFGVVLHHRGALSVGALFMILRYTTMLRTPLERLARHMNAFQQATGAIVRVRELLAISPRVTDGPGAVLRPGPLTVELDGVEFSYGDEPVLRGVSLRLEPGTVLGLLGRTGSGKTTISRLLFRLHDVTGGRICVGGVDIREPALRELRRRVGVVTQDVQLFAGTLRDNVTLFDTAVDDVELHAAFAALALDEWLAELPDGLDTVLGPTARGLSAGEAQLVALARVFLTDPGLVILDEASSRLDPHTEELLEHAIGRFVRGRTAVIIAHRLQTVEQADHIAILDGGRVVEAGRRAVLVAQPDSRFAQLRRAGLAEVLA